MLIHAIAQGGGEGTDSERESALKADSRRKIPCRTGESNLRQRHDGPTELLPPPPLPAISPQPHVVEVEGLFVGRNEVSAA